MEYKSSRGSGTQVRSSEAIIRGIAGDGGLYVPTKLPSMNNIIDSLSDIDYKDMACMVLGEFLSDFSKEEIRHCADLAYDSKFDTPVIAPTVNAGDFSFLELFHGPTLAFKDMALSILPHLMKKAVQKQHMDSEVVILTATSGDTGKAALQGFAGVDGTKIIVFYPDGGVSEIQKAQMVTQEGKNTFAAGIKGNFDDTQSAVKALLTDEETRRKLEHRGFMFSSANSINVGRLIPQIVYYFYGYGRLLKQGRIRPGDKINISVPTGNFGNILSAHYARCMGLPVNKLICASNENNVLFDFLNSGTYDKNRPLKKTSSPSMDILVSSNLERLLYEISGQDEELISSLMHSLNSAGVYNITGEMRDRLSGFYGGYAVESEIFKSIGQLYKETGYVMDTHTSVAYTVSKKYISETGDNRPILIASTASPFKFTRSVCSALRIPTEGKSDFELINILSEKTELPVPDGLKGIDKRPVIHKTVIEKEDIKSTVLNFLGI
jgi:threonine synthase